MPPTPAALAFRAMSCRVRSKRTYAADLRRTIALLVAGQVDFDAPTMAGDNVLEVAVADNFELARALLDNGVSFKTPAKGYAALYSLCHGDSVQALPVDLLQRLLDLGAKAGWAGRQFRRGPRARHEARGHAGRRHRRRGPCAPGRRAAAGPRRTLRRQSHRSHVAAPDRHGSRRPRRNARSRRVGCIDRRRGWRWLDRADHCARAGPRGLRAVVAAKGREGDDQDEHGSFAALVRGDPAAGGPRGGFPQGGAPIPTRTRTRMAATRRWPGRRGTGTCRSFAP